MKSQFSISPGKFGKYLEQYMEPEQWAMLQKTYTGAGYEATWDALLTMVKLFRGLAVDVADHFGFDYPYGDDRRVSAHLRHVRGLATDATEIY